MPREIEGSRELEVNTGSWGYQGSLWGAGLALDQPCAPPNGGRLGGTRRLEPETLKTTTFERQATPRHNAPLGQDSQEAWSGMFIVGHQMECA